MSQLAAMQAYSSIFTRGGFGRQARIDHPAAIRMKRPFECLSLCSGTVRLWTKASGGDGQLLAASCLMRLASSGQKAASSRPLKNSASTAPTRPVWRFFKRFGLTESTQGLTSGLFDRFQHHVHAFRRFLGVTRPIHAILATNPTGYPVGSGCRPRNPAITEHSAWRDRSAWSCAGRQPSSAS